MEGEEEGMSILVEKTTVLKAGGCLACSYPENRDIENVVYQVWMGNHTVRLCPDCLKELVQQAPMRMGIGK